MSDNNQDRITVSIVHQRRKNGDVYVVERHQRYDPEKGYSVCL